MAAVNPRLMGLINQYSQQFNLDPRAVAAVSLMEGGGRFGAIGDHGTSGGPFQLHIGGALPQGRSLAWASTPAGIRYAMQRMAQSGAAGKSGRAAISAIVSNFERPADPTSEIAGALARYGGIQGGPVGGTGSHGPGQVANPMRQGLLQQLMANNQQFMTTGRIDPTLMQSTLQNGLTNADQNALGNIRPGFGQALPGKIGGIVSMAKQFAQQGIPYVWGGSTPKGFDCSGLIQYLYSKAGINLPRTTYQQINVGKKVGWGQFRPGDLIFSDFEGTGKPTHVVMYIGNGKVIAAPHTGTNVQIEDVSMFRNNFIGARRVIH